MNESILFYKILWHGLSNINSAYKAIKIVSRK